MQVAFLPPPPNAHAAPSDWLKRVTSAAEERGHERVLSTVDEDLLRILRLPMIPLDMARCPERERYAASFYNHAKPADFSLRDVQIDGAYTYETLGGVLSPAGVGSGKSLLSIMCAKIALERRGHFRAMIMIPPEVFSQFTERDLPWMRKRLALDALPIRIVEGSAAQRMRIITEPGSAVFIYTYSLLSQKSGFEELAAMSPTCFIQDEAHNIARSSAARTRRWMNAHKVIDEAIKSQQMGPDVRCARAEAVIMSGTITKKKISDYAHLGRIALQEHSPTPIKEQSIMLLGGAIDAETQGTGLGELDLARAKEITSWAYQMGLDPSEVIRKRGLNPTFQEEVREAYQLRLRTAQGVVGTSGTGVDCSLIISWSEPPRPRTEDAERMGELMRKVVQEQLTPDGDTIDYGMHAFKWLWELSAGFYNSLVWPTPDQVQKAHKTRQLTETESLMLLEQAHTHHALAQKYYKNLRWFLDDRHIPGCDTPMLVGLELTNQLEGKPAKHKLPHELVEAYSKQKEAKYTDLPERLSRPVRICDYKIRAAVEWARAHQEEGGLMWFHHPEVGRWVSEYLAKEQIIHTPAFAGQNEAAFAPGLVLCSYAHATGKNLQHQRNNCFIELRREAHMMEQGLGRTHRSGQMADDVRADIFISSGFDLALFNAILRDADYAQATTGQPQRLCYATYSPVVPPTDPRLAMRLGIINRWEDGGGRRGIETHEAITPPEALNWSDVFRSVNYAASKVLPP